MHTLSKWGNSHWSSCLLWSWPFGGFLLGSCCHHQEGPWDARLLPGISLLSSSTRWTEPPSLQTTGPNSKGNTSRPVATASSVLALYPGAVHLKGGLRSCSISNTCEPVRNAETRPHPGPTEESSFYEDSSQIRVCSQVCETLNSAALLYPKVALAPGAPSSPSRGCAPCPPSLMTCHPS